MRHCLRFAVCAVSFPSLFIPNSSQAAEDMSAVIVTATRLPVLLEHSTGDVAVVSRREIEGRNAQRLTDIIDLLPGIFNAPGKGLLQPTSGFSLRGIPDDRRTLLLLDGVAVNDGYTNGNYWGGIPVSAVRQAEVLYGPMSSMFGGNAMGGIVNFVTRMPTAPEFGFRAGYGDPFQSGKGPEAVRKATVQMGTRLENGLSVRVIANTAVTNGYRGDWATATSNPAGTTGAVPITTEMGTNGFLLGLKGQNSWRERGASIKLEQYVSGGARWHLGWQLQEYDFRFGTPETFLRTAGGAETYGPGTTPLSFAGNDGSYARQLFNTGFETDFGGGRAHLLASFSRTSKNFTVTPTAGATSGTGRITDSPAQTFSLDSYWTTNLKDHGFTAGVSYRRDNADSQTYNLPNWAEPGSKTSLYSQAIGQTVLMAAYLQDELRLTPETTIQAGLRHDHWRNSKGYSLDPNGASTYAPRTASAWSPKIGLAYRPVEAVTLRTSAGSAFRAPSIYDLYRSAKFTSYSITANPNLNPETVKTWDAGAEWRAWQGGELRATYFNNDIRDLIYVQGSGAARTRMNAGRAESHGITLALTHLIDANHRLFANYTRTLSEIRENSVSPASVGKRLTNMPDKQANAGFEARRGSFTLNGTMRYASKQFSTDDNSDVATHAYKAYDAYVIADAKLSYRFDRQVSVSLAIDNLFDRDYFSYYPAPRRSWFAELNFQY